jgi:hypothetical protein
VLLLWVSPALNSGVDVAQLFPQFTSNDLYFTGESYAGVYLSVIVREILTSPGNKIAIKGVAIGDGCLGTDVLCGPANAGALSLSLPPASLSSLSLSLALSLALALALSLALARSLSGATFFSLTDASRYHTPSTAPLHTHPHCVHSLGASSPWWDVVFWYGHGQLSNDMYDNVLSVCGEPMLRSPNQVSWMSCCCRSWLCVCAFVCWFWFA